MQGLPGLQGDKGPFGMPGMQGMRVSIDRGDKSPMTGDNHTLCFRCKVNSEESLEKVNL